MRKELSKTPFMHPPCFYKQLAARRDFVHVLGYVFFSETVPGPPVPRRGRRSPKFFFQIYLFAGGATRFPNVRLVGSRGRRRGRTRLVVTESRS